MADTEYLDEERKKTWKRIEDLEQALPAVQKLAEEAKKIAENKIGATEEEATKAFASAQKLVQETSLKNDEIQKLFDGVKGIVDSYNEYKPAFIKAIVAAKDVNEKSDLLSGNADKILEMQNKIKALQEETTAYCSQIKKMKEDVSATEIEATSILKKVSDLQTAATKKKSAIDDLHDEIMGYETEDNQHEDGLKDILSHSYDALDDLYKKLNKEFSTFSNDINLELKNFMDNAEKSKEDVVKEIRSYLPDSVAAGLAGAFNKKKEEEIDEREKATEKFSCLIYGMVAVAILPFFVYAVLFFQDKSIDDIILKIPNMTVAVLPLYAPLIWLAIHLNHRINLSKKLIEEYAYKEAVCKSFAGLSEQIETINDKETLQELRLKLIDLVMSVNSDNPGKYIKNYDKCDNPLIEVLNRLEKTSHIKINGNEWDIQMSDTKETLPKDNITM